MPMMDYREDLQKCHEYVKALEEERRKIEMFPRELPLCLELVTQAIETCKQQLSGGATTTTTTTTTDCVNGQSECSEQTTSAGPAFEEFMPMKKNCSSAQEREEEEEDELESHDNSSKFSNRKSDWLRSVQLWNQSPDPPTKEEHQSNRPRKVSVVEVKNNGGAFQPFKKDKTSGGDIVSSSAKDIPAATTAPPPPPAPAASVCSTPGGTAGVGFGGSKKDEGGKEGGARKSRRCWSPELHRRFLSALQQLGGSHVATPKQIRELMKVDGLTNDEVKSHLQKYRLHTRRPAPSVHHSSASTQAPQFVVVGGIWMPPPEYAAAGEAAATSVTTAPPSGIYAPVAAPPPAAGGAGGGARCNSPAASSSTRTTPAY